MTFAAEPYGVFVDDLLTGLTGGIVREDFVFLPENQPFVLSAGADALGDTVRLHGLVDGAYHRFLPGTDLDVKPDGSLVWRAQAAHPELPAPGATWPDAGSVFCVSYESATAPAPRLTDRNPGSITRTLAESFAREYAVLSRQLEGVYRAGFLATAAGRDLDQVVALVGVERRSRQVATGAVVFSRQSPSPADIAIPAGTRLSTSDVPAISVETVENATLRAGAMSVSVVVRSLVQGAAGVAGANTLTVIHRPILGIESVSNAQALSFGDGVEDDTALRRRAGRALEGGGRATVDAIVGALTSIAGIREQDVLVSEDHVAAPGVLKVTIAAELDAEHQRAALEAIVGNKPAGIKVVHNLQVPPPVEPAPGPGGGMDPASTPPGAGFTDQVWFPVGLAATVTPASASLTSAQKEALRSRCAAALRAAVGELGIGDTVIYNRIVAAGMAVDGILDLSFDLYPIPPAPKPGELPPGPEARRGRRNLLTPATVRPRLDELEVVVRGALVALDLTVEVHRLGLALTGNAAAALATIREGIAQRLAAFLAGAPSQISQSTLLGCLTPMPTYSAAKLDYSAEFVDDGLQVVQPNRAIALADDQQPWIRSLSVVEATSST